MKNQSHLMRLSQAEVQICSFKYTILARNKNAPSIICVYQHMHFFTFNTVLV